MVEHEYSTDTLPYDKSMAEFHLSLPEQSIDRRNAVQYLASIALRQEHERLQQELEIARENAERDDLTGLMRRKPFEASFDRYVIEQQKIEDLIRYDPESMRRGDEERRGLALMNIDLDGFKAVNDSFGHAAGDEVLLQTAGILNKTVRDHDLVCRPGGDEFLLLLNQGIDYSSILNVAYRVRAGLREIDINGTTGVIGASIGVSVFEPGMKMKDMIREADEDMFEDKKHKHVRGF